MKKYLFFWSSYISLYCLEIKKKPLLLLNILANTLIAYSIIITIIEPYKYFDTPFDNPSSIVVDHIGDIYCGVPKHDNVFKFDNDGNLLNKIKIAKSGTYDLRITKNNDLEIVVSKSQVYYKYSSQGKLINTHKYKDTYIASGRSKQMQCRGRDGIIYQIRNPSIYPSIVKIMPDGQEICILSISLVEYLFTNTLFSSLVFIIGASIRVYMSFKFGNQYIPVAEYIFKKITHNKACSNYH